MVKENKKIICHVCGKEKKPYTVFLKNDIFSLSKYKQAREDGEICRRCDRYFAMTGELKEPTDKEFENAKKAIEFAQMLQRWWEKDKKLTVINDKNDPVLTDLEATKQENKRSWEGTATVAKWCRGVLNKGERVWVKGYWMKGKYGERIWVRGYYK